MPFIFVGTGDAAAEIRIYNTLFPGDTGGIVLANANGIDDEQEVPESAKGGFAKTFGRFAPHARKGFCAVAPLLADTGVFRLIGSASHPRKTDAFDLRPEQQNELDFLSDNLTARRSGGICTRDQSMREARAAANLGGLPLIVLAFNYVGSSKPRNKTMWDAWNKHQDEVVQPSLASLSTRGRLVLTDTPITGSDMVAAVRELVDLCRKTSR
jgi:hypothetical protein